MAKRVDGSLGTLLQGVSQQPPKERLDGQVTEQINMTSDVVTMLSRRPPSFFLGSFDVGAINMTLAFVHFYSRGDEEQYFIIVLPGGVMHIMALDFNSVSFNVSAAFTSYITSTNPRADLRMVTVGDYTFVVNKTKTVAMAATLSTSDSALVDAARVDVSVGQFSRDYSLSFIIDGVETVITHTSPASTATGAEADVSAEKIAEELVTLATASTPITDDFDIQRVSASILFIPKTNPQEYEITGTDGSGGAGLKVATHNAVHSLARLPVLASHGEVYKVTGAAGSADDLYMRFQVENPADNEPEQNFQNGVWVEGIATGVEYTLNAATMPHVILRSNGVTTFTAGQPGETVSGAVLDSWADRLVGDTTSNKDPQFVGSTLSDVTAFQDRLTLLASEGVNMSVTRDFFNMFKKTVTTLLADGPIGITSSSGQVNILKYAEQHDKDLIVFADKVQFTVFGSVAVTPTNATMVETTKFKIQSNVGPVPSGQNLFFPVDSGFFSGVREFYTDSTFDSDNARPITVAVDSYIPGVIRDMTSSTNTNKLAVLAFPDNELFYYEYLWDEDERVQNAWSKWILRDDMEIFAIEFFDDSLYILGYIDTDIHLTRVDIKQELLALFLGIESVMLDHKTINAVAVSTVTGLDHLPNDLSLLDAVQGVGCPLPGMRAVIDSFDGSTMVFKSDMQGGLVTIGVKYRSSVIPTQPYIRDNNNRAIGTSKLVLGSMFINFVNSGDFNVDVTADYSYTERNPGRVLGDVSATLGEFNLTSGQFPVPVRAQNDKSNIEIYSDSPYPFTIEDIEWDGQYHKRGTRHTRPGE